MQDLIMWLAHNNRLQYTVGNKITFKMIPCHINDVCQGGGGQA